MNQINTSVVTDGLGMSQAPKHCEAVDPANGHLLLQETEPLTQLRTHRMIPGRRWVFSAVWQQQRVFAKVFLGPQGKKYADRDAQGASWMLHAGLHTPALLWRGTGERAQAQVLVYAAVDDAENADTAYRNGDDRAGLLLLKQLVRVLAQLHAAGLVQTDLHLKNFLYAQGEVWALDGDGVRQKSLAVLHAHRQLAELIAKLRVLDQHAWVEALLQEYLQQRQWPQTVSSTQLLAWVKQAKVREVAVYVDHKIFRNCTDVHWQQTRGHVLARSAAGGLPILDVAMLEQAMHAGQALKLGNTCTVTRAQLQGQPVVIKRYNIKDWWHALGRCWRPSRAAVSWSNAHRLQYYGFLTPQPLAMLETRYFGLRGRAYYVAAWSPWPDAITFFNVSTDQGLRAEAVKQLVVLCYQFYLLQLSHGDMKATNLQITDQGQVVVMDLDSMQQHQHANTALQAHVKDIRRLLQNWKDDTSLYNALLKSFREVYADAAPLKLAGISIQ